MLTAAAATSTSEARFVSEEALKLRVAELCEKLSLQQDEILTLKTKLTAAAAENQLLRTCRGQG